MKIQYYLIHNNEPLRRERLIKNLNISGIDPNNVKWIIKPERNEITRDFINKYVKEGVSITNDRLIHAQYDLSIGVIICTYKHYLCLEDIINNNYDYGVIMEDNMIIDGNLPLTIDKYINELNLYHNDWDILFDNDWCKYEEGKLEEGKFVYLKSNNITQKNHGGSRLAQFYLLNKKCAKKLYDNYIPFNNAPDWYMNDLFRELDIKSYWSEPSIIKKWEHISTAV